MICAQERKSRPRHDPTFSRMDVINSKCIYGENRAQHIRRNGSSSRRNFMNKFLATASRQLVGEIQSQMNQFSTCFLFRMIFISITVLLRFFVLGGNRRLVGWSFFLSAVRCRTLLREFMTRECLMRSTYIRRRFNMFNFERWYVSGGENSWITWTWARARDSYDSHFLVSLDLIYKIVKL